MGQDRATTDFCSPVFLWYSSTYRHIPTLVSCSCWIYLYRYAASWVLNPLLDWLFLVCVQLTGAVCQSCCSVDEGSPADPPSFPCSGSAPSLPWKAAQVLHNFSLWADFSLSFPFLHFFSLCPSSFHHAGLLRAILLQLFLHNEDTLGPFQTHHMVSGLPVILFFPSCL